MKIAILCCSKNNDSDLHTIIGALKMLESGRNEVIYAINKCSAPSLGELWNHLAVSNPADVYALVTDRALCITPNWDIAIADAIQVNNTRVLWWHTNAGEVLPIIPHKWAILSRGIYTNYFPFWFDDTWIKELSVLVHGLPIHRINPCLIISKKSAMTKRMRDLRFWMDFYIAKRPERIIHSNEMRKKLGVPPPDMRPIEEWFKAEQNLWERKWREWELMAGDKSEPDELYLVAKKKAEEFMNGQSIRSAI